MIFKNTIFLEFSIKTLKQMKKCAKSMVSKLFPPKLSNILTHDEKISMFERSKCTWQFATHKTVPSFHVPAQSYSTCTTAPLSSTWKIKKKKKNKEKLIKNIFWRWILLCTFPGCVAPLTTWLPSSHERYELCPLTSFKQEKKMSEQIARQM